ncbi:MAG: ferrous iron transporter B [Steroidobacteraceae bacterium]|nr:ferrous iron transporter B [Steroidobacteraceae bacterium]MDW8260354.1 ferrous iron transporter B [Gammaproteobacteria bacterium]
MNDAAAPPPVAARVETRPARVALLGPPNCGKTALFNRLTGGRQKVANYPGVTVERKQGSFRGAQRRYEVLDLPGTYSLTPTTLDEAIARDALLGRLAGERAPDFVVCVVDATHLLHGLRLVHEVRRLGLPLVVALNRTDLAAKRRLGFDRERLERELGVPVVPTVAVQPGGAAALIAALDALAIPPRAAAAPIEWRDAQPAEVEATHREVQHILRTIGWREPLRSRAVAAADALLMHPILGLLLLGILLFFVFQAVFSFAELPMAWIESGVASFGNLLGASLPEGLLRSLLVDGIVAGVGSVLVFLPQIVILFAFILALEDSGYLPRAAFLLDRVMGSVGLSGRAFLPLLSSFACAIPGILATRTIPHQRDRLATILIAPLMTCSARLPVYALLIGAFIPPRTIGPFNLQGLVLFALYFAGIAAALLVALVMKRLWLKSNYQPLLLELPDYQWPDWRSLLIGLWERVKIFLRRVGGIIVALMVLLWFLSSFPAPPEGAAGAAIEYSIAGRIGRALEVVFAPVGFNWQICIALIPGLAAREVAVGALGTVYAVSSQAPDVGAALAPVIAAQWPLGTALALLAWYVFAPQCLPTLAVVKRETNSWRYPLVMAAYLFALAYAAAWITWNLTKGL